MDITVTPAAQKFMRRMVRFGGEGMTGFRLLVSPGGCSGVASEFTVEQAAPAGDVAVPLDGFALFLPAQSRLLLHGATVDFADTPTESGLVFRNVAGGGSCSSQKTTSAPALATVDLARIGRGGRP
ncbi:MAG: HesB/IscA family protein [Pseudomonadota bacterium]